MKQKKIMTVILSFILILSTIIVSNVEVQAKVKLNKTKVTLKVGKTYTLKLKNNKKKIKWSTSNKKVATVSSKGKIKAKKKGKATITAKVGKKKYKCKVTVKALTQDEKEDAEIRKMANSSTPVYSEKLSNMVFNELNAFRKQNGLNELKTNNAFKNSAKYMALWDAKNGKYAWHGSGIALGMAFENYKLYTYDIIAKRCIYMFTTSSGHLAAMSDKELEGGAGAIYLCNGYAWCVIELSFDMDGMGPDFSSYQDVIDLYGNP